MLKWYMKGETPAVFPKKRSVLLLAAVVLLVCCCLVVPAAAAEVTGTQDDPIVVPEDGYAFRSGSITGFNTTWLSTLPGGGKNVWLKLEIPDKINGQEVNSIKSSAFKVSAGLYKIASVDMSKASSLTRIEDYAFQSRSEITGVILPQSLTSIDRMAFYGCSGITGEITIPAGIKNLEDNVFYGCSKLTGVYLPSQLTTIEKSVFAGCSGLKFIRVAGQDAPAGNFILPSGLTKMGSQAFKGCSGIVGEVTIPEGVTTLDNSVFNGCSGLTGVYLPTGLEQIGTTSSGAVFYGCTGLQFIRVTGQDASVGNFTLPDTLTTIGRQSFQTCFAESVSTPVIIPASVTCIGSQAFYNTGLSYLPITTIVFEGSISSGIDRGAFKADRGYHGLGKRITILKDNESYKNYAPSGFAEYKSSVTYEVTVVFDGVSGAEGRQQKLYNLPVKAVKDEATGLWAEDPDYTLPKYTPPTPVAGYLYSWVLNGKPFTATSKVTGDKLMELTATPDRYPENPTVTLTLDGVVQPGITVPPYYVTIPEDGQVHTVGVNVTHPLTNGDGAGNSVYFKYRWTDIVYPGIQGPRMDEPEFGVWPAKGNDKITIRDAGDARPQDDDSCYLVEIYGYYDTGGTSDALFYKSACPVIGPDPDRTVNTAYLFYVEVNKPVVVSPVNQTIYANEKFPSPLYSGIPENAAIEANGQTYPVDEPPFKITYYNTTTNTPISKPDTPGIYNATIQPVQEGVQLAQITINGNPVMFRNGTLTIRQITDASETIPVAQQTRGGDEISVSVPADTTYYLNDNISLPVTDGNIHLLHDAILAGGEETLKRIAPEYFDDSSKYEMKYFDLIDTNNGHTWVSSSKGVTITWPYPEGTDENTEFTLLHYVDLHREYFTDEDLNSKTKTVMVSKTGSGVKFSIPRSGFSPFALIWSDQKPVPTPPSGGGSSDGNMDNAFRVLFNDGATTLFVVTDLSYGDKLTKPEDPVKDGYTFAGWHKDAACTQAWDFADGIAGDMTLYAKWTPVQTVTPTVTPTATVSVTPTGTAEPSGLPTTTPTVQPTGEDDGGKPAGTVLPLIGGILILILAVLLLLFLLLRHTVTFLIPTGGEITEYRIKVWHGRYIDPADLPELLRTAAWYRDPARRERWDFNEDRVTKSMELYLG